MLAEEWATVWRKAKAPEWLYWLGVIRNNYSKVLGAFIKAIYGLG